MITDAQLFMTCNLLGASLMVLVVFYHYLVRFESKSGNKERVKSASSIKQRSDGAQKGNERNVHKYG